MILESNKNQIDYSEMSSYLKSLYYEMYEDRIDWTVTGVVEYSIDSLHVDTKTDGGTLFPRRSWEISKSKYKSWLRNYKLKGIGIK